MKCDCLICRKNKAGLVNDLIGQGKNFTQIIKELRKENRITEGVLQKHLRLTNQGQLIAAKTQEINSEQANGFDFNSIVFDKYNFEETDPTSIVEYLQKSLLFMYMRQLEIVANEQAKKYSGEDDGGWGFYQLLRLEKIEKMLHNIYPIHIFANQRIAMDVVARMGYKITLDVADVPINTDP